MESQNQVKKLQSQVSNLEDTVKYKESVNQSQKSEFESQLLKLERQMLKAREELDKREEEIVKQKTCVFNLASVNDELRELLTEQHQVLKLEISDLQRELLLVKKQNDRKVDILKSKLVACCTNAGLLCSVDLSLE